MNRCVECITPSACASVGFDCGHDDTERVESSDSTVVHELVEDWHGKAWRGTP